MAEMIYMHLEQPEQDGNQFLIGSSIWFWTAIVELAAVRPVMDGEGIRKWIVFTLVFACLLWRNRKFKNALWRLFKGMDIYG